MAVERMRSSDNIGDLAKELGVTRRCLYKWQAELDHLEPGEAAPRHRIWWSGDRSTDTRKSSSPSVAASLKTPSVPMAGIRCSSARFRPSRSSTINWSARSSVASIIASRSPGSRLAREESGASMGEGISSQAGARPIQARTISGATGRRSSSCTARGITTVPYIFGRISISLMRRR